MIQKMLRVNAIVELLREAIEKGEDVTDMLEALFEELNVDVQVFDDTELHTEFFRIARIVYNRKP